MSNHHHTDEAQLSIPRTLQRGKSDDLAKPPMLKSSLFGAHGFFHRSLFRLLKEQALKKRKQKGEAAGKERRDVAEGVLQGTAVSHGD